MNTTDRPTPTPAEILAACHEHGTTAKGWRTLADALSDEGAETDAEACRDIAARMDEQDVFWHPSRYETLR